MDAEKYSIREPGPLACSTTCALVGSGQEYLQHMYYLPGRVELSLVLSFLLAFVSLCDSIDVYCPLTRRRCNFSTPVP